jgi:hypothetical protein
MPLRKLTQQEVRDLKPSNVIYHVKLWRLWQPAPHLMWEGEAQLSVQRAPVYRKLPERLTSVTPSGHGWAEGGADDVADDGSVVVEDYMLEIFTTDTQGG